MQKYLLPYFGEIDLNNQQNDFYETEIIIDNSNIELSLDFANEVSLKKVQEAEQILQDIQKTRNKAFKILQENFNQGQDVKDYLEHHLEELDSEDINILLEDKNQQENDLENLFKKLHIISISLFFEEKQILFDFSLDEDLTNYVISIYSDFEGTLQRLSIES